ncbi:Hormone receptor 4 [Eumeta japonica]|uniref:Hormone receptor 4 n=1 Tax=Eumeta variegata TaxID=151549 RepID=A0A4C1UTZ6_EUMVA|nr:Hormone receptor 4 [Eumeta japonica]
MVAWTKKLPFILEIPMEIHSKLLMDKWHEISVLTTAAYQAMHGKHAHAPPSSDHDHDFMQEVSPSRPRARRERRRVPRGPRRDSFRREHFRNARPSVIAHASVAAPALESRHRQRTS